MQILDGSSSSKRNLTARFGMGGRLLLLSALIALVGTFIGDNYRSPALTICMIAAIVPFLFFFKGNKNKAANYLLIPASAKEKIIAIFILVNGTIAVLFVAASFIVFLLSELMNLAAGHDLFSYDSFLREIVTGFIPAFFLASVVYCISLFSRSWAGFLIRFFGCIILLAISAFVIIYVLSFIFPDIKHIRPETISNIVWLCASLLFWVIGYFRLKRREI